MTRRSPRQWWQMVWCTLVRFQTLSMSAMFGPSMQILARSLGGDTLTPTITNTLHHGGLGNGVVYVGCDGSSSYALNAKTGQFLWMYATGGAVPTPAVKASVVYVASDQIYALNASNGALLWKAPVSSLSSPAVVGNTVYVSSDQVYALNASTGALIWKYPVQSLNTPAIATGRLYVGARDKNIYALNASTGAFLWKYGPQDDRVASPVVANGVVYAVSYGTLNGTAHLSALDAKTGALLCLRTAESNEDSASSAVVANGIVYFSISWFGGRPTLRILNYSRPVT